MCPYVNEGFHDIFVLQVCAARLEKGFGKIESLRSIAALALITRSVYLQQHFQNKNIKFFFRYIFFCMTFFFLKIF